MADFFLSSIRIVLDSYISDSFYILESGVLAKNQCILRICISTYLATVIFLSFAVDVIRIQVTFIIPAVRLNNENIKTILGFYSHKNFSNEMHK